MNVNPFESRPLGKILSILRERKGILFTSDLRKYGIPRTYLSIMEKRGEIRRVARGVYAAGDSMIDEIAALQAKYKKAVFSHETAAFLLDLVDRTPLYYSVTVPSGYKATVLKQAGTRVFFTNPRLYSLGLISMKSPFGNEIKTFNLERTICDLIKNRNQTDVQQLNMALKNYVKNKDRNIDLLYQYALQFRIQRIARQYMEILL